MAIQRMRQRERAVLMSVILGSEEDSWVELRGVEAPDEWGENRVKDEKKEIWVWAYT